jgi:hypothetical protein
MEEMEMRLTLRNAVSKIKHIASDISGHLKGTIQNIEAIPGEKESSKLLPHLDASRMFLNNIERQLDNL